MDTTLTATTIKTLQAEKMGRLWRWKKWVNSRCARANVLERSGKCLILQRGRQPGSMIKSMTKPTVQI